MAGNQINGSPTAMNTFATGLTAPPMPEALMRRLGTPPNPSGLIEGIAMALLDKAATAELSAYLTLVSKDMADYSVKANTASASYSTADLNSSLELFTAGVKFGTEAINFAKQLSGSSSGSSSSHGSGGSSGSGTSTSSGTTGSGSTGAGTSAPSTAGTTTSVPGTPTAAGGMRMQLTGQIFPDTTTDPTAGTASQASA